MNYSVFIHPDVEEFLDSLPQGERNRCYISLKKLADEPGKPISGCDIKKMSGKKRYYRLRVGNSRFLYVIKGNEVLVEEAFKRGKGYQ